MLTNKTTYNLNPRISILHSRETRIKKQEIRIKILELRHQTPDTRPYQGKKSQAGRWFAGLLWQKWGCQKPLHTLHNPIRGAGLLDWLPGQGNYWNGGMGKGGFNLWGKVPKTPDALLCTNSRVLRLTKWKP
jgi:hypothetical protein